MAYCTQDDLLKRIDPAELAELTAESGEIPDSAVVAKAIAQAEAEIDSYLGRRYPVPFAPVPERIKSLCMDLAIYHLHSRRRTIPDLRRQNYLSGLAFLTEAAAGNAMVAGVSGELPTLSLGSANRVFTRNTLEEL